MKSNYIKIGLLIFLFIIMFAYAYFLLYAPIKVSDNTLLIITMVFTTFVVAIPLFTLMDDDEEEKKTIKQKVSKKSNKK